MHPRPAQWRRRLSLAALYASLFVLCVATAACATKEPDELFGRRGARDLGPTTDADSAAGDSGTAEAADAATPDPALRIGAADTLEVVTWNLHNFPPDDDAVIAVAELVVAMDVDLIALQEVADVVGFQRLMERLPDYDSALSDHRYSSHNYQKTAFVFRKDELTLRTARSIFQDDYWAFPRPPLQAEFDVLRPDGTTWHLVIIDVHLKAQLGEGNEERRRSACNQLEPWVRDQAQREGVGGVIVLGDFNDKLTDGPADNVFDAFLDEPDLYRFTTLPAAEDDAYSYIAFASFIDHILVTTSLDNTVSETLTLAVPLEQWLADEYDYRQRVSDHRPVVSVFARN